MDYVVIDMKKSRREIVANVRRLCRHVGLGLEADVSFVLKTFDQSHCLEWQCHIDTNEVKVFDVHSRCCSLGKLKND